MAGGAGVGGAGGGFGGGNSFDPLMEKWFNDFVPLIHGRNRPFDPNNFRLSETQLLLVVLRLKDDQINPGRQSLINLQGVDAEIVESYSRWEKGASDLAREQIGAWFRGGRNGPRPIIEFKFITLYNAFYEKLGRVPIPIAMALINKNDYSGFSS